MALTRPKYSQIYDTDYKQSVRVATTEDVGNLLATGNMTNSVDGVTLNLLDRILVKDQTDAKQNGIYRVLTVGTGGDGTWGRALDANANDKITAGMTTIVSEGATNISKTFRLATPDPIVIGTTELSFVNPFVITASAGGANTQVQFNDVNQLGGSPAFTFNKVGNVLSVGGNIVVTGSVLPSANVTYDLGSPTQRWRDGWFSGSTIHLGTESLSVDSNGKWMFTSDGTTVELGAEVDFNPASANISGNVTATNYLFANGVPLMTAVDDMVSSANVNLKGYVDGEISTVTSAISTANVNLKGYVDGQFTSLINGSPSTLDTLNEIAAALGNDANLSVTLTNKITGVQGNVTAANAAIVTANTNMKGYVDGQISTTTSAITTANTNMKGYVDTGLSSLSSDKISASASNVTVTANYVNVAINSSNVASFSSTGTIFTGNVGIGNTSPTTPLEIYSVGTGNKLGYPTLLSVKVPTSPDSYAIAITNDKLGVNYGLGIMSNGSTFLPRNQFESYGRLEIRTYEDAVNYQSYQEIRLGYVAADPMTFRVGGSERMRVASSGNVGIGNTAPLHTLSVTGNAFVSGTIFGTATSAQYADLAEIYTSDRNYIPGTVVVFGGDKEVTVSLTSHDPSVAGVVSTNPAYLMNDTVDGAAVALQGRVPCRVLGPVNKGDRVVTSDVRGVAERLDMTKYQPGCIIGKSLDYVPNGEIATIEVVVGRN